MMHRLYELVWRGLAVFSVIRLVGLFVTDARIRRTSDTDFERRDGQLHSVRDDLVAFFARSFVILAAMVTALVALTFVAGGPPWSAP